MPSRAAWDSCDFSSATMIDGGATSGVTYTVTTFPTYFACEIGSGTQSSHCTAGQKLAVSESADSGGDTGVKVFSRTQAANFICVQVSLDPTQGNCGMVATQLQTQSFVEETCADTYTADHCTEQQTNAVATQSAQVAAFCPTAVFTPLCAEQTDSGDTGNADCVLSELNPDECQTCGQVLEQTVVTPATGTGTCGTPQTHTCVDGDGDCTEVANADCVLGDPLDTDDCTACDQVLTQTIATPATGTGNCTPATHTCANGDGSCDDGNGSNGLTILVAMLVSYLLL